MRARDVVMLTSLLSLPVLAVEPVRPAPPPIVRENTPPPLVKPPRPPHRSNPKFVQRRLGRPSAGEGTPLVFSRTKELSLRLATASFEFEPGQPVFSAWPDAKTAWLVRDLDGDGQIASGRELFGSFTFDGAVNGFEALARLDEDGDGLVTARDPAFASLQLWFDRNGDRRVQFGELESLGQRELPVIFTVDVRCDALGNCGREVARTPDGWLIDLHLKFRASSDALRR
jgi:hypothetical protein